MRVNPPPSPMEHMPPLHQPWGPPQGFRPNGGGPYPYGGGPNHHQYMPPPPRQHDSHYAPPDMAPPLDLQQPPYGQQHYPPPHHGIPSYGREASMASTPPAPTIVKQVT